MGVRRVNVWLLGNRDFPERLVKLPEHVVRDLPELIARAERLNPAARWTGSCGPSGGWEHTGLGQNLLRRIPLNPSELL